jgi:hypothetical protein
LPESCISRCQRATGLSSALASGLADFLAMG